MEKQVQIRWGLYSRETNELMYTIVAEYDEPPDLDIFTNPDLQRGLNTIKLAIINNLFDLRVVEDTN